MFSSHSQNLVEYVPKFSHPEGCTNPMLQFTRVTNFVRWWLIFMGPLNGLCFLSPSWYLEFWNGL